MHWDSYLIHLIAPHYQSHSEQHYQQVTKTIIIMKIIQDMKI